MDLLEPEVPLCDADFDSNIIMQQDQDMWTHVFLKSNEPPVSRENATQFTNMKDNQQNISSSTNSSQNPLDCSSEGQSQSLNSFKQINNDGSNSASFAAFSSTMWGDQTHPISLSEEQQRDASSSTTWTLGSVATSSTRISWRSSHKKTFPQSNDCPPVSDTDRSITSNSSRAPSSAAETCTLLSKKILEWKQNVFNSNSSSSDSSSVYSNHPPSNIKLSSHKKTKKKKGTHVHEPENAKKYSQYIPLLTTIFFITSICASCMAVYVNTHFCTIPSNIQNHHLKSINEWLCGYGSVVQNTSASRKKWKHPVHIVHSLLDKSDDHVAELVSDLTAIPSALRISLSAHAALSLSNQVKSLFAATSSSNEKLLNKAYEVSSPVNHENVASTLEELATSLNEASDAIVELNSQGYFTTRNIVKSFYSLLKRSSSYLAASSSSTMHTKIGENPNHAGLKSYEETGLTAHNFEYMMDETLEEMDNALQSLEIKVHWMREKAVVSQNIWHEANGIAEREKRRAMIHKDHKKQRIEEIEDEITNLKQSESLFHKLLAGIYLTETGARLTQLKEEIKRAKSLKRSLERIERDIDMLSEVVSSLQGMSSSIIKLGYDLKALRANIQLFRSNLKTISVHFSDDIESQFEYLRNRIHQMDQSVTRLRPTNQMINEGMKF